MNGPATVLRPAASVGALVGGVRVGGVSLSSSAVLPGDLYIALPGAKAHGAQYIPQAIAAGAVAVLTDADGAARAGEVGVPVIVDPDPRGRMAQLAVEVYGSPAADLATYAVTGTNGKTTTVFILDAALRALGRCVATIGTIGYRLDGVALAGARTTVTTPESPDLQALLAVLVERGADAVAMEVSSHALAFRRVAGICFDVAGFTNLGWDHRDFHPTQSDYFEAKARLFAPGQTRAAAVCVDDEWGVKLAERVAAQGTPLLTTGLGADPGIAPHVSATWEPTQAGTLVHLTGAAGTMDIPVGLPGEHNVRNVLTACAMLSLAGQDVAKAAAGLAEVAVPGRLQRVRLTGDAPSVYVDFAHTPQAVEAALSAIDQQRTVVVLGAGGDRDAGKRGAMGAAAVAHADVVVVTDDNPRSEDPATIRAAVLTGARRARATASPGTRAAACDIIDGGDRGQAIGRALEMAGPGGVVAVLGKGHEQGQQIGDEVHPFDDVTVVGEQWARAKKGDRSWI